MICAYYITNCEACQGKTGIKQNNPASRRNTVKLSLPPWGRWHAKRDGEGISCGICPLTRLRRELSQRESLFSFFLT